MSAPAAPRSRQFPGQHENEDVQLVFHQHPLVMRKQLIGGLLLILLTTFPLALPQVYASPGLSSFFLKVALITPVLVFIGWFYRWIGWYYTVYIVTNSRIVEIKQKGLFDREVQEWQLDKIYNLNYHVGGLQAVMFGYGDITAKTVTGDFTFPTIHKPTEIHKQLLEAVRSVGGGYAKPFDN